MTDHTFTLDDQDGTPVSSSDFEGRRLVVFFYPKAMTPGCTAEACDFRDHYDRFLDEGYAVVGISPDPPADNAEFASAHGLRFPLLSDPDHEVALRYGAWGTKTNYGREYQGLIRSTFVLGPDGEVEHEWRNVRAKGHVARVARELGVAED
jgi:peroxiredoxin Q/BCP